VSERLYSDKLKMAAHLLFFKRGRLPGARGWELRQRLGKNYAEIIAQLNELLKEVDLEVRRVEQAPGGQEPLESAPEEDQARYFAALKGTLSPREARLMGWRIDNLAGIAASLALIVSKQGKVTRQELEDLLTYKFGRWRGTTLVDSLIRQGYLAEDESSMVTLGWRTKAEVDLKNLMSVLASVKVDLEKKAAPSSTDLS